MIKNLEAILIEGNAEILKKTLRAFNKEQKELKDGFKAKIGSPILALVFNEFLSAEGRLTIKEISTKLNVSLPCVGAAIKLLTFHRIVDQGIKVSRTVSYALESEENRKAMELKDATKQIETESKDDIVENKEDQIEKKEDSLIVDGEKKEEVVVQKEINGQKIMRILHRIVPTLTFKEVLSVYTVIKKAKKLRIGTSDLIGLADLDGISYANTKIKSITDTFSDMGVIKKYRVLSGKKFTYEFLAPVKMFEEKENEPQMKEKIKEITHKSEEFLSVDAVVEEFVHKLSKVKQEELAKFKNKSAEQLREINMYSFGLEVVLNIFKSDLGRGLLEVIKHSSIENADAFIELVKANSEDSLSVHDKLEELIENNKLTMNTKESN